MLLELGEVKRACRRTCSRLGDVVEVFDRVGEDGGCAVGELEEEADYADVAV